MPSVKRLWLPLGIALIFTLGAPIGGRVPFEMRIVSEDNGAGVPDLRVTTDNGLVCRTQRGTGACSYMRR